MVRRRCTVELQVTNICNGRRCSQVIAGAEPAFLMNLHRSRTLLADAVPQELGREAIFRRISTSNVGKDPRNGSCQSSFHMNEGIGEASYAKNSLLQVPDGIEDNKGNIYVSRTSPTTVVKAHYEQYERDFVTFLKYRSKELVKGGRMILTMLGRNNEDLYSKGCYYIVEPLVMALKELVEMGLIQKEKVNSFNILIYHPSPAEVKYIVEKEGSFTIDVLETSEFHIDVSDETCNCTNSDNMANSLRPLAEPLLVSHFGTELNMDQVFNKCREIFVYCMAKEKTTFTNVIISMTKRN
uniref:Salicylate carboxymethyltransferase-like n=1 Tax=Nicotiana sylvestris TaxID=4096 RepID=A0A1U7WE68_NICSY|nr:PREDICTED: salicylate carboxymethyltransferase-like [Nicotiana sylvestris]